MNCTLTESRKCWRCNAVLSEEMDQCMSHSTFEFTEEQKRSSPETLSKHKFVIVLLQIEPQLFYETEHKLAIHYDQENQSRCIGYFSKSVSIDNLLDGTVRLTRDDISPLTPELKEWCLQKQIIYD